MTAAKLLRAIESHEVTPVGASRPLRVDARVIAATNQPLEQLVQAGRFRVDLYYRLNVARLDLPPLKQRKEDIPLLVEHAIAEFNRRENLSVAGPDAELLRCFIAHDWPGNVRELRNLVETIFIDPPIGRIRLADLPPVFREMFASYRNAGASERERLVGALAQTNWNKAETAKQLNWSRMTLYRKLAKYHIERSS